MTAINPARLDGVSYRGCGFCGFHFRFYAVMQGGNEIDLGIDAEYDDDWTHEQNVAHLSVRAKQILKELLGGGPPA